MLNKGVSLPSFTVCKGREKGGVDNLRRCVQMPVVGASWGVTRVRVLKLMQVDLNWTLARDSESYINLPEFNEYTIIILVYTRACSNSRTCRSQVKGEETCIYILTTACTTKGQWKKIQGETCSQWLVAWSGSTAMYHQYFTDSIIHPSLNTELSKLKT